MALTLTDRTGRVVASCTSPASLAAAARLLGLAIIEHDPILGRLTYSAGLSPAGNWPHPARPTR